MPTKLEQLKKLWDAGDYRNALKLAATWPRLGEHKKAIQQGWAAAWNPGFYHQMGKDPAALYRDGLGALAERYDLTLPTKEGTRTDDPDPGFITEGHKQ